MKSREFVVMSVPRPGLSRLRPRDDGERLDETVEIGLVGKERRRHTDALALGDAGPAHRHDLVAVPQLHDDSVVVRLAGLAGETEGRDRAI